MRAEKQLEEIFQDLGVDVDLTQETTVDINGTSKAGVQTTELEVYKGYNPNNPNAKTTNIQKNKLLNSGDQISIKVYRRPECPSCGYIPTEEGEPGHLIGTCSACSTQTCPRCKNICEGCGTILCNTCTTGHGLAEKTFCKSCYSDFQEDLEFKRKQESLDQLHRQEKEQRQLDLKEEKQLRELDHKELQAEIDHAIEQREQDRKDRKQKVSALESLSEIEKKRRTQERKDREQELEEEKFSSNRQLEREKFEKEIAELYLDRKKHEDDLKVKKLEALARIINARNQDSDNQPSNMPASLERIPNMEDRYGGDNGE